MQAQAGQLRAFDGAVAIITGGASGIGAALGAALAGRGAVVVLADRQAEQAAAAAERMRAAGGQAEAMGLDVRDAAAFESLSESVHLRHGRIDYLFNNAGIAGGGDAAQMPLELWRNMIEVNVMGVVHGVQAVYPRMVRQGFGHIINTASVAGFLPTPAVVPYGTSKFAVIGLSRSLRIEAKVHHVRVSALCPGVIRTPLLVNGGRFGQTSEPVPEDFQRRFWERFSPMDPDLFAQRVLYQVLLNRSLIIVPWVWRLVYWLERLSPALVDLLFEREYRWLRSELEKIRSGHGT